MKLVLLAWLAFTIISLLVYAFAGVTLWSQLPEYSARAPVLVIFHFLGLVCYPFYISLPGNQK